MAKLIPSKLTITRSQKGKLIQEAEKQTPTEACGVLAGENGAVKRIFPITNVSGDPFRYTLDPEEQLAAFFSIEELGLELVAFFHSHPHSLPVPSPTDIRKSTYPEIPHIIIGKEEGKWVLRAFLIGDQGYTQLDLDIVPN
jgi:proteasome lid subunit RPN8/RPN11